MKCEEFQEEWSPFLKALKKEQKVFEENASMVIEKTEVFPPKADEMKRSERGTTESELQICPC